mgnify:CR=1 FL=1
MTDSIIIETLSQPQVVIREIGSLVTVSSVGVQGPPGPAGSNYSHQQPVASSTWTINHNLGFKPSVTVLSSGGQEIETEVLHTSVNQCLVYFIVATAGSARLV